MSMCVTRKSRNHIPHPESVLAPLARFFLRWKSFLAHLRRRDFGRAVGVGVGVGFGAGGRAPVHAAMYWPTSWRRSVTVIRLTEPAGLSVHNVNAFNRGRTDGSGLPRPPGGSTTTGNRATGHPLMSKTFCSGVMTSGASCIGPAQLGIVARRARAGLVWTFAFALD